MLEGLKRMFGAGGGSSSGGWDDIAPWAQSKQYAFRGVQDQGFVIDGRLGATPWRLEWGPTQRPYIQGQELRIRAEMGLSSDLQVVVMNRVLQETMEKTIFDQYVEGVQTRIDNQTPPEMRWLVMFPKLGATEMGPLKDRYVALASMKSWLRQWLEGPLAQVLAAQTAEADVPVVLMIGRGRLMLRTAQADAAVAPMQHWLRMFETAMREARRVASESSESISPSVQPSGWQPSALPGEEHDK